ncbi:MAG: Rieske (2Fe-2S) domain protein, partial [Nitrospira sp.]|nr:Rieske (2Fe-2S) domain protein [Nitrospira sp.]
MNDLTVTYVSHACLRIDGPFGSLLCDPWFLNEPVYDYVLWKFPPAVIPPNVLLKDVDYLYITHSHEDHFHIPSINKIPRDIRVLLPEYTNHPCLRAQLVERTLREMGFHRITKLHPWETYLLGGNTPFTVVPSAKSRSHDWENSGFVIDHPGSRLINMNDNCDDEELCSEIHERWPDFDIGFIQTSSATVFPACYRMSREAKEHAVSNKNETFTLHKRLIEMLHLRRIVPFAGDFGWYDDRYFDYNRQGRSTPKVLENWIRQNYPDREV